MICSVGAECGLVGETEDVARGAAGGATGAGGAGAGLLLEGEGAGGAGGGQADMDSSAVRGGSLAASDRVGSNSLLIATTFLTLAYLSAVNH